MEIFSARRLTNMGLIAAIYVVATMLCSSLAYGQVQFRISEVLMLLCYFNKDYIISLSIGCLIVNLFSTLGMVDVVFGTLATVVAAVLIYLLRNKVNLVVASLFPVISNAVIVGFELTYVFMTWSARSRRTCSACRSCARRRMRRAPSARPWSRSWPRAYSPILTRRPRPWST